MCKRWGGSKRLCVYVCGGVGGVPREGGQKSQGKNRDGVRETGRRTRAWEREREEESEVVLGGGGCWSVEMSVAH